MNPQNQNNDTVSKGVAYTIFAILGILIIGVFGFAIWSFIQLQNSSVPASGRTENNHAMLYERPILAVKHEPLQQERIQEQITESSQVQAEEPIQEYSPAYIDEQIEEIFVSETISEPIQEPTQETIPIQFTKSNFRLTAQYSGGAVGYVIDVDRLEVVNVERLRNRYNVTYELVGRVSHRRSTLNSSGFFAEFYDANGFRIGENRNINVPLDKDTFQIRDTLSAPFGTVSIEIIGRDRHTIGDDTGTLVQGVTQEDVDRLQFFINDFRESALNTPFTVEAFDKYIQHSLTQEETILRIAERLEETDIGVGFVSIYTAFANFRLFVEANRNAILTNSNVNTTAIEILSDNYNRGHERAVNNLRDVRSRGGFR